MIIGRVSSQYLIDGVGCTCHFTISLYCISAYITTKIPSYNHNLNVNVKIAYNTVSDIKSKHIDVNVSFKYSKDNYGLKK